MPSMIPVVQAFLKACFASTSLTALGWTGSVGPVPGQLAPGPKQWMVDDDVFGWKREAGPATGTRQERFTVRIWVHDVITGATPEDIQASVFAALDVLEAALTSDPTLGGLLLQGLTTGEREYGAGAADGDGRDYEGTARIDVECVCWLT